MDDCEDMLDLDVTVGEYQDEKNQLRFRLEFIDGFQLVKVIPGFTSRQEARWGLSKLQCGWRHERWKKAPR